MSLPTMRESMATDLSAVFARDLSETVEIQRDGNRTQYTALCENLEQSEMDGYGGPDSVALRRIHFKTSDIATISPGEIIYVLEPDPIRRGQSIRQKKVVVSSITSEDGAELIVTCRS